MNAKLKEDTLRCMELLQQLNFTEDIDGIRNIALRISTLYKHSPENYSKILTSKKNCAYQYLITCLREVDDIETHVCLLNMLFNIFNTDKKIARFVNNFGTEAVLESLALSNRLHIENDEIIYQFLVRISQKDSKFSTKCRLYKSIPIFIEKLKQDFNHPPKIRLLLNIVRRCSVMQATCVTLNKCGIFSLIIRFLQIYAVHDTAILSSTLEIFRLLIKNKIIISKSNWNSFIKILLSSYSEFNSFDTKFSRIQDRNVILQSLKIISNNTKGQIYLVQNDAFSVLSHSLYNIDFSAVEKDKEMLKFMNLMLEIVRFCIPAKSLPIAKLNNPITFPIKQSPNKECSNQSTENVTPQKQALSLPSLVVQNSEESLYIVKSNSMPNLTNIEYNSINDSKVDTLAERNLKFDEMRKFFPEFYSDQLKFTPSICPEILKHEVKLVFDQSSKSNLNDENFPLRHLFNQPFADPPVPLFPRDSTLPKDITLTNVARCMQPDNYINQVVYDIENNNDDDVILKTNISLLKFDSIFECGNLRKATHIIDNTYDLILNADINGYKHIQWFYFKVSQMIPGVEYTFNIINMEKVNSQFNFGMQPVIFSSKYFKGDEKRGWYRCGDKIYWYKNKYQYQCTDLNGELSIKSYYTLTFTVKFPFDDDECFLAYHFPYSYTNLQSDILEWLNICDNDCYLNIQNLCNTLNQVPCPLLTITNTYDDIISMENRKYVVLTGRVHPGESNASWVMKGLIDFLLSSNQKAINLREKYIFKIIPMLNPDGVINGNHRCNLAAYDLNRTWRNPSPQLHPTIFNSKSLIEYLIYEQKPPILFCDFHGHSRRKNLFMFGCPSVNKIELVLPTLYNEIFPGFSIEACSYQIEQSKLTCGRVVVGQQLGIQCSYTLESTYCGFDIGPYKGLQLNIKMLEESGMAFLVTLDLFENRLNENISRNLTDEVILVEEVIDKEFSSSDDEY